jgi:hypothetical protein
MMDSERQTSNDKLDLETSFQDEIMCEQVTEEPESIIRNPRSS